MTSWQRALLLVGIAVALALVSLWSGDEPPAPAQVAQPAEVATETAPAVAAGASAPAGRDNEADGARVEASTPASASRSLTVTVEGEVPTTPDGLQVALLFGQRYESELRLRVGRKGTATWTSGDGVAWPASLLLGWALSAPWWRLGQAGHMAGPGQGAEVGGTRASYGSTRGAAADGTATGSAPERTVWVRTEAASGAEVSAHKERRVEKGYCARVKSLHSHSQQKTSRSHFARRAHLRHAPRARRCV